jgi:hypothetical protein
MSSVTGGSYVQAHPNYFMPEALLPYTQASGAFELLPTGGPLIRLSECDLYAYIKKVEIRTKAALGQSAYNQLPGVGITLSQISTPSYLLRVRAEYDHHDTVNMSRWGLDITSAFRLGMRQATFQLMRNGLLYGFNPLNGEGLINANGATATPLPPDSDGNDTVVTYDNGQMAFFIISRFSAMKSRTNQLGIGRKFTILGPQRVLGAFEYQNIVQLVQFQRSGAGSASTAGLVREVLNGNDDDLTWVYDDTLIGKGVGGTDAIIIAMPEVEQPEANAINTNEFAKLSPSLQACTLMLCDMAAPREIPVPLPGGAIDVVSELRTTSGWGIRPECIDIISLQYE